MNATQLIYQAAMQQKTVMVSGEKEIKYEDIEAEQTKDTLCWLCGSHTNGEGVSVKKAIKPTFTDGHLAKAPHSKYLCKTCAFCLAYPSLRNYSIVAAPNKLLHPSRAEMRDILLNPPEPPFVICVAVSGQKWLHIKSQVSFSRNNFPVQLEETTVYVDTAVLSEILEPIEELYTGGFRKSAYRDMPGEIESGEYEPWKVQQFGIEKWEKLEEKIVPHRGQRIFQLALFIAQKKEGN